MVETLQPPNSEVLRRNSSVLKFDVRRDIIQNRGFINFDGQIHESLYLSSPQIISALKELLSIVPPACTKTTTDTKKIIDAGMGPLWGSDPYSVENRRIALKRLLTLSNIASSDIKQKYQKGKITETEFRNRIQPIEGTCLSVFSELHPERYISIEKSRTKK